uniref:Uncharacterized protein n=1 Tax=Peronospora matthiolae TaxID=2874970 RepID=A0AAV1TKB7_9STRA
MATTVPALKDGYFIFLRVGDSMADRYACFAEVESMCRMFTETLKVVEDLNAEEVLQRMELTVDSFEQMCAWENDLDFRFPESSWRGCAACLYKGALVANLSVVVVREVTTRALKLK